ncbi:hypothetical protein [Lentibacillus sp. CBA3610]|uniref:hypothetical protein n=1 Tax=Lentibacillus sp. CBA3610 TaxID=2518176 RepID=UPI001595DCDA|nr:hypothetical protein [Lentibacillus sp. CBA3610]QKY69728.1 hypothetical protein Len3610_09065 [Lentibacillus sp. CBA3610]
MRKLKGVIIMLFCVSVLMGCSMPSEEEAIKSAEDTAEDVFNADESIETNQQLNTFSMHVPQGMDVVEEDATNVVLEDGEQTYIVFYNNLESPLSKLSYESAAANSEQALLLETFVDQEKFGYIRVLQDDEEDSYELQTGIGGVKITTYTSKSGMERDSEAMMSMARSIVMAN